VIPLLIVIIFLLEGIAGEFPSSSLTFKMAAFSLSTPACVLSSVEKLNALFKFGNLPISFVLKLSTVGLAWKLSLRRLGQLFHLV
jgi:hypothetical protein